MYCAIGTVCLVVVPLIADTFGLTTPDQKIALFAAIIGSATLILVVGQLILGYRQVDLQRVELRIIDRQDKEAHRKAHLRLFAAEYNSDSFNTFMTLYVANNGERTATAFKVHLYCAEPNVNPAPELRAEWSVTHSKLRPPFRSSFSKDYNVNCYVGYRTELPQIRLTAPGMTIDKLAYRLIYEDGFTPSISGLLPLTLRRPDLEPPEGEDAT